MSSPSPFGAPPQNPWGQPPAPPPPPKKSRSALDRLLIVAMCILGGIVTIGAVGAFVAFARGTASNSGAQSFARAGASQPPHLPGALPDVAIIPATTCDARIAMHARLRERSDGIDYATRALRLLEIMGGVRVNFLGWAAESADEGPPCLASFAYEAQGVRHTVRFRFWPDDPPRLATANSDATEIADSLEAEGLLGPSFVRPTQEQLGIATLNRIASGINAEDVYMHPTERGVLVIRREHCVAGNVDMRGGTLPRTYRAARITRVECHADENWAIDIPPRGPIPDPHL